MNEIIGKIVVGIITVLSVPLYKKIILPCIKRAKLKKQQRRALEQRLLEMPAQLDAITKQIFPNGGSSLFDLVKGQQARFDNLEDRFDNMQEEQNIRLGIQRVAFWKSDKDGAFTYVSPAMCRMLNREAKEFLGYEWKSCLLKSDLERVENAWEAHIEEKRRFEETFYFESDVSKMKVHATAYPILDKTTKDYKGSYGTLIGVSS